MKFKKDKKLNYSMEPEKKVKQKKKSKLVSSGETAKLLHTELIEANPAVEKPAKALAVTSVLHYFTELTNREDQVRMDSTLQLLQQLSKTKEAEKREKELTYTLKRLVRGCGASTNTSRAGFFTALVAFLKVFAKEDSFLERMFETVEKELHVGATIANKEDADAVVGKILTCGAILRAELITIVSNNQLEKMTNILLQATKHRTYHTSLGFSFLLELIELLTETQFRDIVWPHLQNDLIKTWSKQTLQTVHCLIATKRKFPSVVNAKYLKAHFGASDLLNTSSYQVLYKIFWENSDTSILLHPAFETFATYIASSDNLPEFWKEIVDPHLEAPTKLLELETLKIATDILNNISTEKTDIVDLLSHNFMCMLVGGLRNLKQKKDETLKAFYNEFMDALVASCSKTSVTDSQRVDVVRRIILPPGTFNIEQYTTTRVVHQLVNSLTEKGVFEVFDLYKSIFLDKIAKNQENSSEKWLNLERQNAGSMLQLLLLHKSVARSYSWRAEQLQFFFTCGVFYVNDTASEICKKDASGAFSKDFGDQCKNMFFSSLKNKVTDLQEELQILLQLMHFCNDQLQRKHPAKYFRIKYLDDKQHQAWTSLYAALTESTSTAKESKAHKRQNSLQLVFQILLSNMGLQLFREPEMAASAVEDLLKCMKRTEKQWKSEKTQKTKHSDDTNNEPEWIEVLVDLFLHFLSHNYGDLRSVVNSLFPHLCGNLNLSSIHQILAMLDMKDGQNPLSAKEEKEDDDDNDDSDEDEDKLGNGNKKGEDSEEDEEDDDDDDDDDDDEDDDDDLEDGDVMTESEKLRNAISQVLVETGAAVGHGDDDMDSVDLNDISEEEGKKLDEALGNAFKAIKKSSGIGQQKKSKNYRVQTTTLMHFRTRVLDLIEIYLQQSPKLLASIEIMLALYDMLQFCVSDDLKPLLGKVQKVLNKLTAIKTFTCDNDVNEDSMVDFIRLMLEKKSSAAAFDMTNKLRNKCVLFLINSAKKLSQSDEVPAKVVAFCHEAVEDFINSRNPKMNITLLWEIFKLRWSVVWELAVTLAEKGISMQTRIFRRIQIYEILSALYKNNELLRKSEPQPEKKLIKKIEKSLVKHIQLLDSTASGKLSAKEFQTLLELLLSVHHASKKLKTSSGLLSAETCNLLQNLLCKLKLESSQLYNRFCATFELPMKRCSEVSEPEAKQNGDRLLEDGHEECEDKQKKKNNETTKPAKTYEQKLSTVEKRKKRDIDPRKEKKLKKEQRFQVASRGLNGGIAFTKPVKSSDET